MLSLQEKIYLLKTYYAVNKNKFLLKQMFRREFNITPPDNIVITRLVTNFETTGSVSRIATTQSRRKSIHVDNIESYFAQNPGSSIRQAANNLDVSSTTIHRILKSDLKFKPYKTQTRQLLSVNAKLKRFQFANDFDTSLLNNIWFSDESYFYLNPNASKNAFIWSKTKPLHNFVQKPSHSAKILVWMAISHHGVFWRQIEGNMNTERYINLLKNDFFPYLTSRNLINTCTFMQDGAPCHTSKGALELIHQHFKSRVISTKYPQKYNMGMEWPPYSPDLTPLDFCIWGTVKARIAKHKPLTLFDLTNALRAEVSLFTQEFIISAISNMIPRIQSLRNAQGGHIET